jgi:hypothetical protein
MKQNTSTFSLRWAASVLGSPGLIALLLGGVGAYVLIVSVWSVGAAFFGPTPRKLQSAQVDKEQAQQRDAQMAGYIAQIHGRSLLIKPAAPEVEVAAEPVNETPTDPPKPTVYGGPALTAMMFDSAWFADGSRLNVGEEPKNGLAVVSLNPPWEATVKWRDVEFKVPLFERDKLIIKASGTEPDPSSSPVTPPPSTDSATPSPTK